MFGDGVSACLVDKVSNEFGGVRYGTDRCVSVCVWKRKADLNLDPFKPESPG